MSKFKKVADELHEIKKSYTGLLDEESLRVLKKAEKLLKKAEKIKKKESYHVAFEHDSDDYESISPLTAGMHGDDLEYF